MHIERTSKTLQRRKIKLYYMLHEQLISHILSVHRKPFNRANWNFTMCYMTTWCHTYWAYIENHSTEQIETLPRVTWALDISHIERTSKTVQQSKLKLSHVLHDHLISHILSVHRKPFNGGKLNFTTCYMTTWYHTYWAYIENRSTEENYTLRNVTWPLDIAHIERT